MHIFHFCNQMPNAARRPTEPERKKNWQQKKKKTGFHQDPEPPHTAGSCWIWDWDDMAKWTVVMAWKCCSSKARPSVHPSVCASGTSSSSDKNYKYWSHNKILRCTQCQKVCYGKGFSLPTRSRRSVKIWRCPPFMKLGECFFAMPECRSTGSTLLYARTFLCSTHKIAYIIVGSKSRLQRCRANLDALQRLCTVYVRTCNIGPIKRLPDKNMRKTV